MKTALSVLALSAPSLAFAHDGVHTHPHGSEGWIIGMAMISVAAVLGAAKARKAKVKA